MKTIRNISLRLALVLLLAAAGAVTVSAQTPDVLDNGGSNSSPTVQLISNLSFSTLQRQTSRTIDYRDGDAASFIVDAERGRTVILNVTHQELVHPQEVGDKGLGRGKMQLEIRKENCAYSIDNGLSWNEFKTSLHNQRVSLPSGAGAPETYQILVRIGGTITANHNQRRGGYEGELVLAVEYQ